MASRDINDLDQKLHGIAVDFFCRCRAASLNIIFDCTYRSPAEQDQLYAQGRTTPGSIVTHAKAGESAHNYTLPDGEPASRAFDIAIYDVNGVSLDWNPSDMSWKMAHDIGRDCGLVLGADWPEPITDPPHFELQNWRSP